MALGFLKWITGEYHMAKKREHPHGTLEYLRTLFPGRWLLIQLDGPEAEEGTVLAADEDPEVVDRHLNKRFEPGMSRRKPLYVTYSLPEGQDLPTAAL
jgi:hypothetical protein